MESESDILKRVRGWIKGEVEYYICFCKVALFVAAAVFCHTFVNYTVISILAIYFTETLKKDKISRSALLVNVREALQVVVEVGVYAKRSHFRKIIIISTAAYILGLIMLYLSASNRIPKAYLELHIFSCLIAVGKAGGVSFLRTYLLEEIVPGLEKILDIDYNRAWRQAHIWVWVSLFGFFLAPFTQQPWSKMFLNSVYLIGAAGFFSLLGSFLSHQTHSSTESESINGHRKCPDTPPDHQDLENNGNEMPESSQITAGAEAQQQKSSSQITVGAEAQHQKSSSQTAGAEAQQKISSLSYETQESLAKVLLKMIPMWTAFIVPGLVISIADTFFSMQDDNMEASVTTSNFLLAKDVLKGVVAYLCTFLVSKRLSKSEQNLALKLRLCLGMMFSILCSSFAWQVEVWRLKIVHESGLMLDKSKDTKAPITTKKQKNCDHKM